MSSMIRVGCPHCGRHLQFRAAPAGEPRIRLQCPACQESFLARRPSPSETSPSPVAPEIAGPAPGNLSSEAPTRPRARGILRRKGVLAGTVFAGLLTLLFALWRLPGGTSAGAVGSLAVMGCLDTDQPAEALASDLLRLRLGEDLQRLEPLRVITPEEVERAERDLELGETGEPRGAGEIVLFLDALANRLGVEAVFALGCTGGDGQSWEGLLRISGASELKSLGPRARPLSPVTADPSLDGERLEDLSRRWADEIRRELLPAIPQPPEVDSGFPASPGALNALAEALGFRRKFRYPEARKAFRAAQEAEPGAWLSFALQARLERFLGDIASAGRAADKALATAEEMPQSWRWELEALAAEAAGDEAGALAALSEWATLPGEELAGGLARLRLQLARGRGEEAAEIHRRLLRQFPDLADDPRPALAAAEIAALREDFDGQLAAAQGAALSAEALRGWGWRAAAALEAAEASLGQGRFPAAAREIERAQNLYRQLGDGRGSARALLAEAIVALAQGDRPRAGAALTIALEICQDLELGTFEAPLRITEARLLANRGDRRGARRSLETARQSLTSLGNRRASAALALAAASLLERLDFEEEAGEELNRALGLARELEDPLLAGKILEQLRDLGAPKEVFRELGPRD